MLECTSVPSACKARFQDLISRLHSSHGEGDGDPQGAALGKVKHAQQAPRGPPQGCSAGPHWQLGRAGTHTPVSVTVTPLSGAGGEATPPQKCLSDG